MHTDVGVCRRRRPGTCVSADEVFLHPHVVFLSWYSQSAQRRLPTTERPTAGAAGAGAARPPTALWLQLPETTSPAPPPPQRFTFTHHPWPNHPAQVQELCGATMQDALRACLLHGPPEEGARPHMDHVLSLLQVGGVGVGGGGGTRVAVCVCVLQGIFWHLSGSHFLVVLWPAGECIVTMAWYVELQGAIELMLVGWGTERTAQCCSVRKCC